MNNPFTEIKDLDEISLVNSAQRGDLSALEKLIETHQAWIYNIAVRMVLNRHDAEDITQEIIVKIITRLSTFKGKSSFRTWLYRVAFNHIINMKKKHCEEKITNFSDYGNMNDQTPDYDPPDQKSVPVDVHLLIEEAKIGCMTGMLLCLERKERFVYTLGEIFNANDSVGSEILKISKENFRTILSRARKNLHNFMNEKCGLIDLNNPCRCSKKTSGWIREGIVDPNNLQFSKNYILKIKDVSENKSRDLENLDAKYAALFREHPFQVPPDFIKSIEMILNTSDEGKYL